MGDGWRQDLPGIRFAEFYERFGAACRSKNVDAVPTHGMGRLRLAVRLLLGRLETTSRRLFPVPRHSSLPNEFIRLDPWEAAYLFAAAQVASRGILEIGRFNGGSTFLFACANEQVPVWSVDLAPRDDELLERLLAENDVGDRVELLVGDSHQAPLEQVSDFDLLFVDGDHTRDGALADLERFYPRLQDGGQLLVHDCYPDMEVQQAVLDFVGRHEVEVVQSPYIPSAHWHMPAGSIAHFVKP